MESIPQITTFKLSLKEVKDFVKLRISNNDLFSGKRNTSIWAWRAILKHMGLQHKMTHSQASKKWENLKKRYKELKNPPDGTKVFPETWPYFTLMHDAMEGRLKNQAPTLKTFPNNKDNGDFLPIKTKKRKASMVVYSPSILDTDRLEIEVSLNGDDEDRTEEVQAASQEIDHIMQEVEDKRNMMDNERQVIEREKRVMERERLVLQRERAVLDREIASLDRDRASLEREKVMIDGEIAVFERERAMVEKDRNAVNTDRLALEQERARLERHFGQKEWTDDGTENSSKVKDSDTTDRKERFLYLFEKLIGKL
ncbi:hypothetical protein EXN66_Car020862 [Channa argus]|uniref:Myb/SANT-like DNA-binding domain-containing protein n=1 Tax=Channa argus TaxID=215402 RepID=A0A6G1QR57_CHAAH|nr:hypothetical protein EXN66_Car020862 [Channa argus]